MNKEDYVSLEVAKLLKDKNFDEPCDCMYNFTDECFMYSKYTVTRIGFQNSNMGIEEVVVPTLYEAQKWLRKQYNAYVNATPLDIPKGKDKKFTFTIDKLDENKEWDWGWETEPDNYYTTYEEALNQGILEALKLI